MGIGQPPLSQQIQTLERELGTPLFRRTHSGAELTLAGEAFLGEVRRVLADVERAAETARRVARGESGRLRLGFTASAAFSPVVPRLIRDFRRTWPQVELLLDETNTASLLVGLAEGRLDAAFVRYGLSTPADLQLLRFTDEPMKIAVPAAHPWPRATAPRWRHWPASLSSCFRAASAPACTTKSWPPAANPA